MFCMANKQYERGSFVSCQTVSRGVISITNCMAMCWLLASARYYSFDTPCLNILEKISYIILFVLGGVRFADCESLLLGGNSKIRA